MVIVYMTGKSVKESTGLAFVASIVSKEIPRIPILPLGRVLNNIEQHQFKMVKLNAYASSPLTRSGYLIFCCRASRIVDVVSTSVSSVRLSIIVPLRPL